MITHQSIGRLEDRFEGTENYDRHAVANQNLTFPLMPERTIIEFTFVQLHMQIRIQKVVEHAISALVFSQAVVLTLSKQSWLGKQEALL